MTAIAKVDGDREGEQRSRGRYGVKKPIDESNQQKPFDSNFKDQSQQIRNLNHPSTRAQNDGNTRVEYAEGPDPRLDERQGTPWVLQSYSNAPPPSFEKPQIIIDPSGSFRENQGELVNSAKNRTRPWFPKSPSERPPIPRNSNFADQSNVPQSLDDHQRRSFAIDHSDAFKKREQETSQRLTKPYTPQILPYYKNEQPSRQSLTKPWFPQSGYGQPQVASGQTESPSEPIHKVPLPLPIQNLDFSNPGVQQRYDQNRHHSLSGLAFQERIGGSPEDEQRNTQSGTEGRFASVEAHNSPTYEGNNIPFEQERLSGRPEVKPRFEGSYLLLTAYEGNKYQRPVKLPKFDPIFSDQDGVRNARLLRGEAFVYNPGQNFVVGSNRQDSYQVQQTSPPTPGVAALPTGQSTVRPYINPKFDVSRSSDGVLNIQIEGKSYQIDPSKMFRARTGGRSELIEDEEFRVAVPDISAKVSNNSNKSLKQKRSTGGELSSHAIDNNFNTDPTKMIGARPGRRVESSQEEINVESGLDPDHTNFESAEEAGSEVDSSRVRAVRSAEDENQFL
ncbi:unnamed protein product [Rodentolepis nana]|uniref:ZM domain-containing protein n=1 Tax=Rodentolepis nana TaxID=102285 RepID=A0A0R3TMS4_RODNA|nr:unnamed protein product [Rodentolepis nana]